MSFMQPSPLDALAARLRRDLTGDVLFDAAIHYERDGWRAAVNLQNATDRRFVSSCSTVTACFYGEQRRIIGSVSYTW